MLALWPLAVTAMAMAPPCGLRVCKNSVCRKAGSQDTLETLFALASTSDEANALAAGAASTASLAAVQASFAASRIEPSGCLTKCGLGPNCVTTDGGPEDIFHDVYKPATCVALLEHVGVSVPEEATRAWVRMRRGIPET